MRERPAFLWIVIVVVACVVYVTRISHEGIWYDEACSAIMAEHSLAEIITLTAYDNHPPLYYLLLRIVRLILGNSEWALRSLSAAGAVGLVSLGAGPIRRIFGDKTAFTYVFVILFTPAILIYAQEARMYTLAIFAVTASVLYGYLAVQHNQRRDWVCFGVASLAAAYLHYYGLIAAFFTHLFVFFWLLFKKRAFLKAHLITGAAVVAGYLPWLSVLLRQTLKASNGFWLAPISLWDVEAAFYKPFAYKDIFPGIQPRMSVLLLLSLLLIVCGVVIAVKRKAEKERTFSLFLLFVFLGTILTTIIVSMVVAPIFYSRYMMVCTGLFLFLVSLGISQLPGRYLQLAVLGVYAFLNIFTLRDVYTQNFNFFVKDLAQDLKDEIQPGDLIITSDSYSLGPATYYFPEAEHYYSSNSSEEQWAHVLTPFIPPLHFKEGLKELLSARQSFWYISCSSGISKNIWTIIKGEKGWEADGESRRYSEAYSPVAFTAQKFFYSGREDLRRGTIEVRISGIKPMGSLFMMLYDKESPFWQGPLSAGAPPYRFEAIRAGSEEMLYSFDGVEYGEYVLVIAHDEDADHKIDLDDAERFPEEGVFILNGEKMDPALDLDDFSFEELKFLVDAPEESIDFRMAYAPF